MNIWSPTDDNAEEEEEEVGFANNNKSYTEAPGLVYPSAMNCQ